MARPRSVRVAAEPDPAALGPITPAEERVLSLLCHGASNRVIAQTLVLSPRTVEGHVSSLLFKTGCQNRTQLTLWRLSHPYTADGHAGLAQR